MSNIQVLNPFPINFYKFKCTHHKKIKDYLMKHVYPDFEKNGPNGSLQSIYTDYLPGTNAMVHWPYMYNLYLPDVNNVLQECGFDIRNNCKLKLKGWYNFTRYNENAWVHDHTGGSTNISFSFVHYIVTDPDENASTVFINPNNKYIRSSSPTKNVNYLPKMYTQDITQFDIEEGDILFFPSWIDHSAPKHTTGNLRVTNAVNVMLKIDDEDDGF